MDKVKCFEDEIKLLKIKKVRDACTTMIELLPDYFFEVPASSTGKYRPDYALGEGGLLRHSKAAARIGYELLQNPIIGGKYTELEQDLMIMALMIHDGFIPRDMPVGLENDEIKLLMDVIKTHMGAWTTDYQGNEVLEKPKTKYQTFVHMCDYLASRKCILIPFDKDNRISV